MNYSNGKIIAIANEMHEVVAYDCTILDLSDYAALYKTLSLPQVFIDLTQTTLSLHHAYVVMECPCTSEEELQNQLKQFKLQADAMKKSARLQKYQLLFQ